MLDTRAEAKRQLGRRGPDPSRRLAVFTACLLGSAALAFLPEWRDLGPAAQRAFFILLFAASLWITEAIPAFAVGLLVIATEIALLGRPGGAFATSEHDWELFIQPWASGVIWLFFGGFVMAEGAVATGLDRWLAASILNLVGQRAWAVLLGTMGATFVFSMFLSNTAATALMVAAVGPVIGSLAPGDRFARTLLLGIPCAASLGGMGTIVGTPPNAIAAGALAPADPVSFAGWIVYGLPPALLLCGLVYGWLLWRSRGSRALVEVLKLPEADGPPSPLWQRVLVMAVFTATIGLWLTAPLHDVPTPAVSFVPIVAFTAAGILGSREMRRLPWDVLLLLAGGLSLGVGVQVTGLAQWIVDATPADDLSPLGAIFLLGVMACGLSNFISHTAAANILIPIALALGGADPTRTVIPIALTASLAMALPASTPPNAIAFASGRLKARDFVPMGVLTAVAGTPLVVLWCWLLG